MAEECHGLRIGIFGGTFNPVHLGHLRSAEEVREAFALDRIYFVPAARPPHKNGDMLAPAVHRLRMVEEATADNVFFFSSALELQRMGPSYSIDTIRYFVQELQPTALFFLIGIDAFHEMHTWKEFATIPALCNLIITSRPGFATPAPEQLLPVALRDVLWYDPGLGMFCHTSGHRCILQKIHGLDISASQIRALLHHQQSIRYLVPSAVASYIAEHSLYQQEDNTA